MGFLNQAIRNFKQALQNLKNKFSGSRSRKKRKEYEPTQIPQKWQKNPEKQSSKTINYKNMLFQTRQKKKIPGFLWFKRILAGFLLFVNFILSQVLLGSLGESGQPMFVLFLMNCFILADYLWKTRRQKE